MPAIPHNHPLPSTTRNLGLIIGGILIVVVILITIIYAQVHADKLTPISHISGMSIRYVEARKGHWTKVTCDPDREWLSVDPFDANTKWVVVANECFNSPLTVEPGRTNIDLGTYVKSLDFTIHSNNISDTCMFTVKCFPRH